MNYVEGNYATTYTHPNEQSGYVIFGKYRLRTETLDAELKPDDSYSILENVPHSFEVIEGGKVIDVFIPIREDYL